MGVLEHINYDIEKLFFCFYTTLQGAPGVIHVFFLPCALTATL